MRKRLYSVLKVQSFKGDQVAFVVCETFHDDKDVHKIADRVGDKVTVISREGIYLNDYEFVED